MTDIQPIYLLLLTILLTGCAYAITALGHRRLSRKLQALARRWQMHYSPRDQLRISARVAQAFPVPGAANVRVIDLVYGQKEQRHRFIFTVEYTLGVLRAKHRAVRVASFSEGKEDPAATHPIRLAPALGSLIDQYQTLAPTDDGV